MSCAMFSVAEFPRSNGTLVCEVLRVLWGEGCGSAGHGVATPSLDVSCCAVLARVLSGEQSFAACGLGLWASQGLDASVCARVLRRIFGGFSSCSAIERGLRICEYVYKRVSREAGSLSPRNDNCYWSSRVNCFCHVARRHGRLLGCGVFCVRLVTRIIRLLVVSGRPAQYRAGPLTPRTI